jgi:hypothetical protein
MLMKNLLVLLAALAAVSASAQTTNAPAQRPVESYQAQGTARSRENRATLREVKANEIVAGKVTYSGILVEVAKTRRPLQLVNPLAPPVYGGPEDNIARDPVRGKILGLKFFEIKF